MVRLPSTSLRTSRSPQVVVRLLEVHRSEDYYSSFELRTSSLDTSFVTVKRISKTQLIKPITDMANYLSTPFNKNAFLTT
jgi:hypothetical protein